MSVMFLMTVVCFEVKGGIFGIGLLALYVSRVPVLGTAGSGDPPSPQQEPLPPARS